MQKFSCECGKTYIKATAKHCKSCAMKLAAKTRKRPVNYNRKGRRIRTGISHGKKAVMYLELAMKTPEELLSDYLARYHS